MAAFTLNAADLKFVLKQIQIAEAHANGTPLTEIRLDANGNVITDRNFYLTATPEQLAALALAIPDPKTPFGLRTVDGSFNNILDDRQLWGAAGEPMPRLFEPNFTNLEPDSNDLTQGDVMDFGPSTPDIINNNYGLPGHVADADPRTISNLVVDMSFNNPAAIVAALTFAGSENIHGAGGDLETAMLAVGDYKTALADIAANAGLTSEERLAEGQAALAVLQTAFADLSIDMGSDGSLIIPNVAPDEGLSAPFNAWMTFFGQFFDHGLDLISKGGNGTVYVPLQADDPLITHGPDGVPGTGDEASPFTRFMALTRSTEFENADGEPSQRNVTTSWVDQNQTYTSHASHQVFLREYKMVFDTQLGHDVPIATGKLLGGADGGLATWADVKSQALTMLGIELSDADALSVPLLLTDPYGEFIRDANGFPQVVTAFGPNGPTAWESGTPGAPLDLSALNGGNGPVRTANAFLDDIAHNAVPVGLFDDDGNPATPMVAIEADIDGDTGNEIATDARGNRVAYDNELLDRHFITGDGRGNENIGLTAVHHIFHSEHNRQVDSQKLIVLGTGDTAFINEWLATDIAGLPAGFANLSSLDQLAFAETLSWDGERLFQAARFATEMQYQHLVFEEFARKVQPAIDPFVFNSVTDINPSIFAEFANVVYRFGHSMLTENMPRVGADGQPFNEELGLVEAFLNPVMFDNDGSLTHDEGAAAIVRGMTIERGNEIDEFITGALRNNLLGLPLDLASINIARGRDTGMPTLNQAREQLYAATSSSFLTPYTSWVEFAANLKNPMSIVNFIAAYGEHDAITSAATLADKRAAAWEIVFGVEADGTTPTDITDRLEFLNSTGAWATEETGFNLIDLWIGGLAEKKMPFGGMLGSTFNAVFEAQLEALQDGDRFYYLTRTQGQNFLNMLEQNSFAKMIMANTSLALPGADGIRGTADDIIERHIGVDSFATYDYVFEVDPTKQADYNGAAAGVDPAGADPVMEALGFKKVLRDDPGTPGADSNYLRTFGGEHVVVGGTNASDTIITDFGDDGIWGDDGDDRIESGAGVDLVNGGAGNDIITDSGDTGDFLKGDEGNDVIANSNGLDVLMGGSGKDAIFVGVDDTEVFGGEGDDFILGGDGVDFLLGNEGSDWIEAGAGFDTTAGDNSELFFNSNILGHDVMFAGSEEHDFDAESGDDIMVQGESVMRNEGMFGFDWASFQGSNIAGYADMRIRIFTTEEQDILRNRFDKVEALSGSDHNDTLRGDDREAGAPPANPTVGNTETLFFQDELSQAGLGRIEGLRELLGGLITVPNGSSEQIVAFTGGNILLGGGGSDTLQGNGGNDFLDGNARLNVRIRITESGENNTAGNQIATVDSLKHVFTAADGQPAWVGKSLFELMLARTITPDQLHIVREIVADDGASTDIDTAVFNDSLFAADGTANYTIESNADGSITVTHVNVSNIDDPVTGRPLISDGADTVRNVERLQFTDQTIVLTPPQLRLNGFDPTGISTWGDNFDVQSYGNNNAGTTASFTNNWVESGDGAANPTAGSIQITAGGTLTFSQGNADNSAVTRSLNLSNAVSATVAFTIGDVNVTGADNEEIFFEFAANGTDFVTIETFDGGNGGPQSFNLPTNVPFSGNAAIRFRSNNTLDAGESFSIDNLTITANVLAPAASPSVNHQFNYAEQSLAQSIGSFPDITDDGTEITSARIVFTNPQAGDILTVGNLAGTGITAASATVGGQVVITLTGPASHAAFERAIQAVTFSNNSDNPVGGQRVINVTVNDGFLNSNVATTTITVVPVNDAPNAVTDNVVTNITGPILIPEWMMLRNDTDAEGSPLTVTGATENDDAFAISYNSTTRGVTATRTDADNTNDFTYTASDGALSDTADVDITWDTDGIVSGTNGADIILGNDGNNTFDGNAGNDLIIAGAGNDSIDGDTGNDEIMWEVGHGRDFVNGGANTDTMRVVGNATAETYNIYSRTAWLAVAGNTAAQISGATEIIITRNGANAASIVVELDNIEEIVIDGMGGGDTFNPIGTFAGTSLLTSTITVNGGTGNDIIDFSALSSAHRIVFRSNGGNDTIVGDVRPQDVIELAPGQDLSTYTLEDNGDGTHTFSNGTHSITFTGAVPPQFGNDSTPDEDTIDGAFEYTPGDVAGLEALVKGLKPDFVGDDDVPVGVREVSGYGNNEANPTWGAADQAFIRLTEARYGEPDAFGNRAINPVFDGLDARTISNILGAQEAGLPKAGNEANIFFMAMGQYIDHGLDFLPKGGNGSIQIGAPGGGAPGSNNPADLTRGTVMGYEAGVPQHKNQTSPYVDQNQAYGSHSLIGQFLREGDGNGGLGAHLFAGAPDPSNPQFNLLPTLRELILEHWNNNTVFEMPNGNAFAFQTYYPGLVVGGQVVSSVLTSSGIVSNFMGSTHPLLLDANPFINILDHYVAGDGRANENFALTSIHTVWARNHNHHVEGLEAAGFDGTAEELFQAAKMINEAEYQRVVFDEYLETLLGGLRSEGTHGFEEYDPTANAAISHEFAAAVFRFGHSLIGQTMTILDEDGNPQQVQLFDAFLNPSNDPSVFPVNPSAFYTPQPGYAQHGVNNIVGGTVSQAAENVDFNIVDAVRNDLVRISADLFAFNVSRGWDVGLGTLNQVRKMLTASADPYVSEAVGFAGGNLSAYTSWEDFQTRNGLSNAVIAQFQQAYPDLVLAASEIEAFRQVNPDIDVIEQPDGTGIVKGIDRVDLWVGGLAEQHINGGIVGQTFWVVLHEQFERLQDADRFYYISRFDNFDFYESFIDGQEFADIVARNTGMTNLPEHMFRTEELDDVDNDDDNAGNDDDDNDDDGAGNDDDDDDVDNDDDNDDDDDDDNAGNDDDDDDGAGNDDDDDDDPVIPVPGAIRTGTPQSDVLVGTAADDNMVAFASDDVAIGEAGADSISGGDGDDFADGGAGRDVVFGGAGNDQIFGGSEADIVFGDAGDDRIFGEDGNDMILAGAGNDTAFGGAGDDQFVAEAGDGNDVYFGDESDGGAGTDTLDMTGVSSSITVHLGNGALAKGYASSATSGNDVLWGIENVNTGFGNDTITASNAVNVIDGGAGNDTFVFPTIQAADGDRILGFEPGDKIDLSGIDANAGLTGNQSFTLVNGGPLTAAGQLAVSFEVRDGADVTVLRGNVSGNADAEFEIEIEGHHELTNQNLAL